MDELTTNVPEPLRRQCPECGGKGECTTSHRYTCPDCRGRGWVPVDGVEELMRRLLTAPPR